MEFEFFTYLSVHITLDPKKENESVLIRLGSIDPDNVFLSFEAYLIATSLPQRPERVTIVLDGPWQIVLSISIPLRM